MANRIFVNTGNELYRQVTENAKGAAFGLGNASDFNTNAAANLGRQPGEIFFYADDLQDKRRKLQIALDNLTNPTFFVDGVVNPKTVEAIIKQYYADFQANGQVNNKGFRLAIGGSLITAGITGTAALGFALAGTAFQTSVLAPSIVALYNTTLVYGTTQGSIIAALAASGPVGWITLAVAAAVSYVFGDWIGDHAEAKAEDDAQRWTFARNDFPSITGGVIRGPGRRSIKRLYDDRSGRTSDFPDNEAIARLTREILTDALFSKSVLSGNGILQPGHPGTNANRFTLEENLFPFRKNDGGPNQTYVDAIYYISSYISLIDAILSLNDDSLSRSPDTVEAEFSTPIRIQLTTAKVRLYGALATEAQRVISEKFLTFFDERKEYKTLLNFGTDNQYLAESWRLAPSSTGSIQLKLFTPLNQGVQVYNTAYISRELAKSVIDNITFELSEELDFSPLLRPRNTAVGEYIPTKQSISNVTLQSLNLITGSAGAAGPTSGTPITYGDTIFRRWYNNNINASELNIDFSDYTNFVEFGSAKYRLDSFLQKLKDIEKLDSTIVGSVVGDALKAQQKESIIRGFDAYEQYLYFATASIYSASAYYTDEGYEYNATGSWPRSGSTLLAVTSSVATNWYNTQSSIAQRFDDNNSNYLVKHLPNHIQEDADSSEFLKFVAMFGHVVDDLKVYIDQFTNIYSTTPDPFKELTMDQVYEVASSFGLTLPNVYSLEELQTYVEQVYGQSDSSRSLVAETWKRFIHILVYLYKIKGSRNALSTLLNVYGINSPALQIKETKYPSTNNFIQSEELTYGLKFTSASNSYVRIPFVSASGATPIVGKTLVVRFNPTTTVSSSLLTGDLTDWAVNIVPHPSASSTTVVEDYGRVEIISGSNKVLVASSSYFPLFSDDYTLLVMRSASADFTIMQADGDQILYQYSASSNLADAVWNNTTYVYVGGTGSIKTNTNFDGIVDEVRLWNENLTNDNIVKTAYDPGQSYGASYSSSYDNLYVNLTFSQPSSSITASATNESPYYGLSILPTVPAVGFTTASYQRLSRNIKQFVLSAGTTVYSTNKVVVADPPVFDENFVDINGTKVLRPNISIKSIEDKKYIGGVNFVAFAASPTDFINQNIIRTMGNIDVNNMIGNPRDLKDGKYDELDKLFKYYKTYYNKTVNPNEYIDFYRNLVEAPAEMSEKLVPSKAKLATGIIIESPVLSRKKLQLNKDFEIGGSNTKALENFLSGSGSVQDVGVFSATTIYDMQQNTTVLGDITPLLGVIDTTLTTPSSSYLYFEAPAIDAQPIYTASAGYPRKAFADELINSPADPFYAIPPRSDLLDYGTTTYFHKSDGIYPFELLTQYKQLFLATFDIKPFSSISPVYSKISLLSPSSTLSSVPGRYSVQFGVQSYGAGETSEGFINSADIFSLIGITGGSGLRLRMYRNAIYRENDPVSRPVTSPPTGDHGVLFDGILEGISDVMPFLLIQTDDSTIYYRITNPTASIISTNIRLDFFAYQSQNIVPSGYLPRHYRFIRDNMTALKRRNYIGCKSSRADNITDPTGRVGISDPFYTITSDYTSIDVVKTLPGTPPATTPTGQPRTRTRPRLRTDN